MKQRDVEILAQQDKETLAAWWSQLNHWEWPNALPDPEPNHFISGGRRGEIIGWIMTRIGYRECLRDWNKGMSDEEFATLYEGRDL